MKMFDENAMIEINIKYLVCCRLLDDLAARRRPRHGGVPKIELSEFDKTIIDYALEIALIQIEKEITIVKLKENYLNDFISDILSGNIQSKEELLIRAKLFDIDIDGYSSVIIFDIDNYKYSIVQKPLENIKLEEIKRKMFEKIIQNFELLKSKILYYKKSDSLVLITKPH